MVWKRVHPVIIAAGGFLLAACAAGAPEQMSREAACRDLLARVDRFVDMTGTGDAAAAPVDGYPYLRVTRFLASFENGLEGETARHEWVARMRALDREARRVELVNADAAGAIPTVEACADYLLQTDKAEDRMNEQLDRAVRSPRHYDDGLRALGLYPLTQIGVAIGFERWKSANLPSFSEPALPSDGARIYHLPSETGISTRHVSGLIAQTSGNALGIPDLEPHLDALAGLYAPVWHVTERGEADQIGNPAWRTDGTAAVETDQPTVFVRLAHTRFRGEVLPQLVYTVWFPERPKTGMLDILGGPFDALVWRVTLNRDGAPILYDSFHACGCYHLFFPVPPLRRVDTDEDHDLREAILVPQEAPRLQPGERIALHIDAGSHYLTRFSVSTGKPQGTSLRMISEHQPPHFGLRSIADRNGRRSLFSPSGLVSGSARLERFILWPMGIESAGAMRQWGTHATAFVGDRHADDPFLLEGAFE